MSLTLLFPVNENSTSSQIDLQILFLGVLLKVSQRKI